MCFGQTPLVLILEGESKGWRGCEPGRTLGQPLRQEGREPGWVMVWARLGITWMWGRGRAREETHRCWTKGRWDLWAAGPPAQGRAYPALREGEGRPCTLPSSGRCVSERAGS